MVDLGACLELFAEKSHLLDASDAMPPFFRAALQSVHWSLILASAECMAPSSPRVRNPSDPYTFDESPTSFSSGRYFPDHHGLPATLDLDTPESSGRFEAPAQRPCLKTATTTSRTYRATSLSDDHLQSPVTHQPDVDLVDYDHSAIDRRWSWDHSASPVRRLDRRLSDRFAALYGKRPKRRCFDCKAEEGRATFSPRFLELTFFQLSQKLRGQDFSSYDRGLSDCSAGGELARLNGIRIVGVGKLRRFSQRESATRFSPVELKAVAEASSFSRSVAASESAAYSISIDRQNVLKTPAEKRHGQQDVLRRDNDGQFCPIKPLWVNESTASDDEVCDGNKRDLLRKECNRRIVLMTRL